MKLISKKGWKNFKAFSFGIVLAILICEIFLRIYNPFPFALKQGKLVLPANQKKVFENKWIKKLDEKIYYSRNSLGFRGPELPDSISKLISIITIGGSTTECKFLSDSSTWPFLLYQSLRKQDTRVWLNNAGNDGHSTFGHLLLLQEYILKLKPDYALFLTGINDEETDSPDEFDLMTEKKITTHSFKGFIKSLLNHTEIGRTAFNFYHVQIAYKKGLVHREINPKDLIDSPLSDSIIENRIASQAPYIEGYKKRIAQILTDCKNANIKPVLITQPSLFGNYTDSSTNVVMGNKWVKESNQKSNCILEEKVLEMYNDVLRSFSQQAMVIDLAREMPKNSVYYYDFTHFTKEGAKKVSAILYTHLSTVLFNNTQK
ncbi:MAG: SGNH/GDSL hydrolase family protein [Bacteroidetes bacterium]|nr:SGNH/GDSL hydrolase family protein [Bacteroidota bacterium]